MTLLNAMDLTIMVGKNLMKDLIWLKNIDEASRFVVG